MTYNELIYNLKNLFRGGITSDDDNISNKQLLFIFNYYRAKLVREDLNKGRTIDRSIVQDLGCVPVQCVDAAECCEVLDSGTSVLRTVEPVPKLLELHKKDLLLFVGTADKQKPFQISTEAQIRWSAHNKYTGKLPKAYMRSLDNYLYIVNAPRGIEYINIQGVFQEPQKASEFNQCDGTPCFTLDSEYPVSSHMVPVINELIMTKELRAFVESPTDETNNTKEDAGE